MLLSALGLGLGSIPFTRVRVLLDRTVMSWCATATELPVEEDSGNRIINPRHVLHEPANTRSAAFPRPFQQTSHGRAACMNGGLLYFN